MALHVVLSPLISLAVKKSSDALIQHICRMWGMDDDCNKLHRYLLAIQEKITDAEERRGDSPAVKEWMKLLKAAAHAAVDVLDEFQYEALRQNAISQGASASFKVIKGFFSSENPAVFRYKMSNKLTEILVNINEIVTEMNKFNLTSLDPTTPSIDRQTHSFVTELEVIGRDGEKDNIISELLDPQRKSDNISVLAIVGMPGVGKTTLAQLVYNDERVKGHFQLLLWVCVSTEFDIVNIMKSIIEVATYNNGGVSISNKEVLQRQLRDILDRKRYLLVLDDVWNEEIMKWEELRTLLFSGVGLGSVIIVTTRNQGVASIMETLPTHDLASLTEEDSWELFQRMAFGVWVEEPPEKLRTIGRTIAHKCGGLPLALKALGGLMKTKREVSDWRLILESNVWDGLQSTGNVLSILKLSYDHLPPHFKQCFAFCAIFPQDYEMERETLIQLWMANDFIPTDRSIENLEDKGRSIFNELYSRSFFQNIREKETYYGCSIITCQMHDLMHNLATEIAGKNKLEPKELHHLMSSLKPSGLYGVLKQFPNIHTGLFQDCWYESTTKKKNYYLLKSCSLRAFQCCWKYPPKELGYMKHIRYIDLSWQYLTTLPKAIIMLYNLQTLKLSNSQIQKLPAEMRYMINLRHLFLDGCSRLKRMPIGLGQLRYLRTLTKYVVCSGRDAGSIRELNNLNLLGGHISLSGLEMVRDSKDAHTVNLAAKTNLCSLELKWVPTNNEGVTRNHQEVLQALTPDDKLKYLNIRGYSGFGFSKWLNEDLKIRNLKRLMLKECINCAEIPPLWQLPLLEDLSLEKMDNIKFIVGSTYKSVEGSNSIIIFPALKDLKVESLSNLESWYEEDFESLPFPKLNKLIINHCPKLKFLSKHMPLLAILRVEYCRELKLEQIFNFPTLFELHIAVDMNNMPPTSRPDAFRPPIRGFENVIPLEEEENKISQTKSLRRLVITESDCLFSCGLSNVVALKFWKYFAAIEDLRIDECDALVFWPKEELRSLKCLKALRIYWCNNLIGSLSPSPAHTHGELDSVELPLLEKLDITFCAELVEVPAVICSNSLKHLTITNCPKLSREGLTHLKMTNLTELYFGACPRVRAWPDNMKHLPSIQRFHIWEFPRIESFPQGLHGSLHSLLYVYMDECPRIESFPQGLQQRLPSLQSLHIYGCPTLERRCRSGGDYWHLVSRIPDNYIDNSTKWKSFSNGLLSCLHT